MTIGSTTAKSQRASFVVDDVVLRGEQWHGGGRGHVVLLHGGGQTRYSWSGSAERLARDGWDVTTIDLRGHGDSDWAPDGEYGLERHARDLAHVIEELEVRPVVVGASLGGLTALTLQASRPATARALVLVDIVPRPEDSGTSRISDFMNGHLDGFRTLDDVAEAIARYKAQPTRKSPHSLRRVVRQRADGRWYWHWDPRIMELRPGQYGADLLDAASVIPEPMLVVRGLESDVVSQRQVDEFLRHAPQARSVDVAGVGHMVAGDNNHRFFAAIEEFLDSLP